MKWHISVSLIAVLFLGLFYSLLTHNNQAQAQGETVEQKITVLSPMGIDTASNTIANNGSPVGYAGRQDGVSG